MGGENEMRTIIFFLTAVIFSGVFWYGYFFRREKRLLDRLQRMIDRAAAGELTREEISEEKRSALENSLKRYLDDSMLVNDNQQKQKEIIQGLISDISHQTLTPISNLKIYTELLGEEQKEKSEMIDTIQEQTEKLDFLIQSLVKLSRMESGIIAVHPRNTEVSGLFEMICQEYERKSLEKQVDFWVSETNLKAKFDLKWTAEAVGNIVDNAVKYTESGGKIAISAQAYSFFVRIDIKDSGIGIEPEEIPKIFTRFYRSFSVSAKPGVGIGLYLAREIIQAQKGYVKVASKVGEGSVFSVFLPLEKGE